MIEAVRYRKVVLVSIWGFQNLKPSDWRLENKQFINYKTKLYVKLNKTPD